MEVKSRLKKIDCILLFWVQRPENQGADYVFIQVQVQIWRQNKIIGPALGQTDRQGEWVNFLIAFCSIQTFNGLDEA